MPRSSIISLQFLTYCLLIGLAYAIDGPAVHTVKPHKFGFIVSISNRSTSHEFENLHFCTGTLITATRVVTAAHCLKGRTLNEIEILAGSVRLDRARGYYPESWITFDQWNPHHGNRSLQKNDIAVIKLRADGVLGVTPVEMLLLDTLHQENRNYVIAGWGETMKGNKGLVLRRGPVQVLTNEECSQRGTELKNAEFRVPPNYFCTMAQPFVLLTCGDGGAPVLNRDHKLVGVSVGTCPNLKGYLFNDEEFLQNHKMNAHLRVHVYTNFIFFG